LKEAELKEKEDYKQGKIRWQQSVLRGIGLHKYGGGDEAAAEWDKLQKE